MIGADAVEPLYIIPVDNGDTGVTGVPTRSFEVGHRELNEPFSESVVRAG